MPADTEINTIARPHAMFAARAFLVGIERLSTHPRAAAVIPNT
jgi:hypothetical protein